MSEKKPGVVPVAREDEVVLVLVNLKQTKGGIILPEARDHDQRFGKVISVGPGAFIPGTGGICHSGLKEGDLVLLGRNKGVPFILGGQRFVYISMHEIPVVLRMQGSDEPASAVDLQDLEPVERLDLQEDTEPMKPPSKPRLVIDR